MKLNRVIFSPFFQRLALYGSGFASVLIVSSVLSVEDFAKYSLMQSAVEMSTVLCSLGTALLFVRRSAEAGKLVRLLDVFYVLILGFPLVVVAFVVFWFAYDFININLFFIGLVACVFSAFVQLSSNNYKYFDSGFFSNNEPTARIFVFLSVLYFLNILGCDIDLIAALCCSLVGFLFVSIFSFAFYKKFSSNGVVELGASVTQKFGMLVYSLPSFVIKKFDLLAIGLVANFDFIAAFKIAFLLAEAPLQFLGAYINSKISVFANGKGVVSVISGGFRMYFLLGVFSQVGILLAAYLYQDVSGIECFDVVVFLIPYFITRSYTAFHENLISLRGDIGYIKRVVFFIAFVKYSLIFVFFFFFKVNVVWAYVAIVPFELVVYERVYKKIYGDCFFCSFFNCSRAA